MNKIKETINKNKIKPNYLKNGARAFFVGGLICVFGQFLLFLYQDVFKMDEKIATSLMSISLIFIAVLLTVCGVYDKIGQFAGAGTIVPITGFANSMTSSGMEAKSEGVVLGIAPNIFKLAGAVISFAVLSAFVFGTIRYVIMVIF